MTRRAPLAAAALALAALLPALAPAPAAAQDGRDLARISAYLNALDTAEGGFVQIAPDGETSDGRFYIDRPGRIRFEYTPPNPSLVVSDGTWVVVYDMRDCGKQTDLQPRSSEHGARMYTITPRGTHERTHVQSVLEAHAPWAPRDTGTST